METRKVYDNGKHVGFQIQKLIFHVLTILTFGIKEKLCFLLPDVYSLTSLIKEMVIAGGSNSVQTIKLIV